MTSINILVFPELKVRFRVNPNYKNISSDIQSTPINMIVSLAF